MLVLSVLFPVLVCVCVSVCVCVLSGLLFLELSCFVCVPFLLDNRLRRCSSCRSSSCGRVLLPSIMNEPIRNHQNYQKPPFHATGEILQIGEWRTAGESAVGAR